MILSGGPLTFSFPHISGSYLSMNYLSSADQTCLAELFFKIKQSLFSKTAGNDTGEDMFPLKWKEYPFLGHEA